ncbi:MAG: iron ABC transporter permease [Victivallaceae bacterium]|nr:iron ABC transporter permease [Victivallaceae bacterium]
MDTRRFLCYLTGGVLLLFLVTFLLGPIYAVAAGGLNPGLIAEIFRSPVYVEGLCNALAVAAVTTVFTLAIALPLALLYNRYEFRGKALSTLAIMAPMILPPFVGALGFQQLLGHYGVFNSILTGFGAARIDFLGGDGKFWAVCAIEALHLYPILYLNLITALANIDPAYQEAARNLGASPRRRFFRITLPLVKPGIFAGGSIVLIWSFTELGTPLMFNYTRITPVQVFNGITELERNQLPLSLVVIMLAVSALLYLGGKLAFGRPATGGSAGKGSSGSGGVKLGFWAGLLPAGAFAAVTLIALAPHISLVLIAFSRNWYNSVLPESFTWMNFDAALSDSLVVPSIINSLRYSLSAMLIAVAAGVLISLAVVRWKLRGGWLLDTLAMLPLAVPGIVMAFGFLVLAYANGFTRMLFDVEKNPLLLLAAAYAVRRLPYVVRAVSSGLEQTPAELENAGRNLGAGAWRVLRRITLPLVAANILVGALFAFSFSMLEVSDSLILAQKAQFYPITKAIYELSSILGEGRYIACAFGVWAMLFLASTLALAAAALGKKIGAIFRL